MKTRPTLSRISKADQNKALLPVAIDLFAGCGGLTYGLGLAGFNVLGAIEIERFAAATYEQNHPSVVILKQDIRLVDPLAWVSSLGVPSGKLDLLAGCPPCQGFSALRTRNGSRRNRDNRNSLISEMTRFAALLQPKVIMMENVPDLRHRRLFQDFTASLRQLGYTVKFTVEDARYFGVPQRRRRLILLASRIKGLELTFAPRSEQMVTVRDAIGCLPPAGFSGDTLHDYSENRTLKTQTLISRIPKDGGGRLALPMSDQLACHLRSDGYKDTYGRMAWDGVAPTITTGCFNPSKGRFLHPQEDRCITMREAALLQGFPASFKVPDNITKTQAARMLGNALPPEFIRRHAIPLRRSLLNAKE